ncbi:MAG: FRG domain-containing protein [Clostridium sp.]|uniref:FRG domain-containing protein n=1 Tax=Clostridium sp. TaxID=1506 RepID=UPI003F2BF058
MYCEEEFEINSFEEYIEYVKNYIEKNKVEIWYRGQSSNMWQLKPNLFRTMKRKREMLLNYEIIDFKNEFKKLKKEILENNLFDISKLNDFQIMFIAQHYGLLTPILDWSTDPLVALFFALDNYTAEKNENPVIYIIKPSLCNEYSNLKDCKEPLCIDELDNTTFEYWTDDLNRGPGMYIPIALFSDIDFSHRICRQSGKFTFHSAVGPRNRWDNVVVEGQRIVETININPKAVNEMKDYLLALNITRETIYRKISLLDNVCKQFKDKSLEKFKKDIEESNKKIVS